MYAWYASGGAHSADFNIACYYMWKIQIEIIIHRIQDIAWHNWLNKTPDNWDCTYCILIMAG